MQWIMWSDYPLTAVFLNYQTETFFLPRPLKHNCNTDLGKHQSAPPLWSQHNIKAIELCTAQPGKKQQSLAWVLTLRNPILNQLNQNQKRGFYLKSF